MLRRVALLPAVVLALVVQTLALISLSAAPAHAADPLGLEAGDLVIADSGHGEVIVVPADGSPDRVLATGLDDPEGVAVTPEGDVVVAESGADRILLIPADGSAVDVLNSNGAWGVSDLALDGQGNVLFGGTGWGGIGRVPLTGGAAELFIYDPPYPNYSGLAVAPDGDIIGAEWGTDEVVRFDEDGNGRTVVPELSYDGVTGPRNVGAIDVTRDGHVLVSDTYNRVIWERDGAGGMTSFGTGLNQPVAIASDDTTGVLYAADHLNDRVVMFSADRSTQTDVATDSPLLLPYGVAVVPPPPIAVGDTFAASGGSVLQVADDGSTTLVANGFGAVTGLAVDGDGDLVLTTGAGSVVEIAGDGTAARTTLATGLGALTALALGPEDEIYVGNAAGDLLRVNPGGGTTNLGGYNAVPAIAVGPDGTVYFSDALHLYRVGGGGALEVADLPGIQALTWDPARKLLAAGGTDIHEVDPAAGTSTVLTGAPGTFLALVVDTQGRSVLSIAGGVAGIYRENLPETWSLLSPPPAPTELATYVPRPVLTDAAPPLTGNVDEEYDGYTFAATDPGGLGVAFTVYDGDLPPGLSLDPATGELAGTPTTSGSYEFRVQAANPGRGTVSDAITIEIGKRLQTITFTSTNPSPVHVGDTYEPTATSPGGTVTFSIDPASSTVCSYSSVTGDVTFLTSGSSCVILADQAGDADYEAAPQASQSVYVDKQTQTVSFTTPLPTDASIGRTYAPDATSTSGLPVTFEIHLSSAAICSIAAGVVTFDAIGTCRVVARQVGNDDYWSDTESQVITVGERRPEVVITSTPPSPALVGQQYDVVAVGPGGGAVTIGVSTPAVCSVENGVVTFEHAGECVVGAASSGADPATQRIQVRRATTTLDVALERDVIVATVSVLAPGGGTPTGEVVFTDHGAEIGTGELFVDGEGGVVAVLAGALATGEKHSVAATYAGSVDHLGSESPTVERIDPTIAATVKSRKPISRFGWYRTPVRITFTCTVGTAPLVGGCPGRVKLTKNRRGLRSITAGVSAEDDGGAQVNVAGIRIDRTAPKVVVKGDRKGSLRCKARDRLSGVASCTVKSHRKGGALVYRAEARDKAGNVTVLRGRIPQA